MSDTKKTRIELSLESTNPPRLRVVLPVRPASTAELRGLSEFLWNTRLNCRIVFRKGKPFEDRRPLPRAKFLRSKSAAAYLGVSEWTLRQLVYAGEMEAIQRTPCSPFLFDKADLDAWAERNKR
jgi:excisionase family DNA binding protein